MLNSYNINKSTLFHIEFNMELENWLNNTNRTNFENAFSIDHMVDTDLLGLKLSTELHIVFLTIIYIFGVFGNVFVIKSFAKKDKIRSFNIYVISFASCDLLACIICASQMPLLYLYKTLEQNEILIYIKAFNMAMWLAIFLHGSHLMLIAIDRVKAVYKSNVYTQTKRNVFCKTIIVLISSIGMIIPISVLQTYLSRPTSKQIFVGLACVYFAICMFTLVVSYTLMLHKIVKSTNSIHPIETTETHRINRHKRIRINKIVKQFFAITVIYFISFVPQYFGIIYNSLILRYLFYINQMCNPIVYFVSDSSFRSNVIQLLTTPFRKKS